MCISYSELLFYWGIALMVMAVLVAVICIVLFRCSGKRLKKRLEKEYGNDRSIIYRHKK